MDYETARRIQRAMTQRGFMAAAEEFMDRAQDYTVREAAYVIRAWL